MCKKRLWGITLALLLTAALILGQGTLSAKNPVEESKSEETEEQKLTEAASTENVIREITPNIPKIGGGGSKI